MRQLEEPVALPRGVADAGGERGFVRNADEAIDAIRLDVGALLWRSGVEAEPIHVAGSRLVAACPSSSRPNALEILLLDIEGGGRVVGRTELDLPDGIVVSSRERRDFEYVAVREGASLALRWTARVRYRGGAPPAESSSYSRREELRGKVVLDVRADNVSSRAVPPDPEPDEPPSHPYRVASVWREVGWRVGSQVVRLRPEEAGAHRRLVLDTVGDDRPRPLLEGTAFEAQVTPCGRFVFARASRPPGSEWGVFSAVTGERLTTLRYEDGYEWPCVIGPRIYNLTLGRARLPAGVTMTLRAADLHSGALLWEHDLGASGRRPPALAR